MQDVIEIFCFVEKTHSEKCKAHSELADYQILRDALIETIRGYLDEEVLHSTLRRKTSIPYEAISPLIKKEVDLLNTAFMDPDCPVPDEIKEDTQGLLLLLQGGFAKGFGYGINMNRGRSINSVVDSHRNAVINGTLNDAAVNAAMQDIMGGVDMKSLHAVSEILSVVEASLIEVIKPDSLEGPLMQVWMWGFITGWEYDNRKILASSLF